MTGLDGVPRRVRSGRAAEQLAAEELVARALEQDTLLTGPGGLLRQLTRPGLETAVDQELTDHPGRERNGPPGRLVSRKYWNELKRDLRPVSTAVSAAAARAALDDLAEKLGDRYLAVIRLWTSAWEQFILFPGYNVEIRRVICSTSAIESLNARYRRVVKAFGHFPGEQAALKCPYLVTGSRAHVRALSPGRFRPGPGPCFPSCPARPNRRMI